MRIPVLVEPNYRASVWAQQTIDGILKEATRKKYEAVLLEETDYRSLDMEKIFDADKRLMIIVGTSISWVPETLEYFSRNAVGTILVSFNPPESSSMRGIVRMDYVSAMQEILNYLTGCGRKNIALYGVNPNSSADAIKRECFERFSKTQGNAAQNIFYNRASLAQCYADFKPNISQFDVVICTNDIVAASLLRNFKAENVRVPEEMYMVSFGDSSLAQRMQPQMTSASLEHEEMGRQAVRLFAFLYREDAATSVSLRVRSRMLVRASTAFQTPKTDGFSFDASALAESTVNFYADAEADALMRAECLLDGCDETDEAFLRGLAAGEPFERMGERLFLSASALRYRLKRMMAIAKCDTKEQLGQLLRFCQILQLFDNSNS